MYGTTCDRMIPTVKMIENRLRVLVNPIHACTVPFCRENCSSNSSP